jgi:hypothetical protein
MPAKSTSVSDKLARFQDALRAGRLDDYLTAKPQNPADRQALSSWGPMMRV